MQVLWREVFVALWDFCAVRTVHFCVDWENN